MTASFEIRVFEAENRGKRQKLILRARSKVFEAELRMPDGPSLLRSEWVDANQRQSRRNRRMAAPRHAASYCGEQMSRCLIPLSE